MFHLTSVAREGNRHMLCSPSTELHALQHLLFTKSCLRMQYACEWHR